MIATVMIRAKFCPLCGSDNIQWQPTIGYAVYTCYNCSRAFSAHGLDFDVKLQADNVHRAASAVREAMGGNDAR